MATNATSGQETDGQSKTELRAKWEGMEFRVPTPGAVRVENVSYGEDSDEHVYVVSVESGIPVDCTCEAWKYHNPEGGCKHMIAVENQSAVVMAASQNSDTHTVATDGGVKEVRETFVRMDLGQDNYVDLGEYVNEHHERPSGCTCWGYGDVVALSTPTRPCKTCREAGFTEPAPNVEVSR